jgi:lantibiotic modifying enzyme
MRSAKNASTARKLAATLIAFALLLPAAGAPGAARPNLEAARDAERWIRSSAIQTKHGTVWPADPRDPKSVSYNLYSGTPGVVLFYAELYRSTGDTRFRDAALKGARALLAAIDTEKDAGLYTGLAGIGFTLAEVYKATKYPAAKDGALRCARLLGERARKTRAGVEWSDTTDIISGSAGTGLFLLYMAREFGDSAARETSIQAGLRLIELARPENGGLKWAMDPKFPRLMPNFSHGTAGVAYFLATLYKETRRKEFLDAALAGAKYLISIAQTDGGICLIFHNEPEGRDLYYLGWCHGPAGTARLWYRLYQVTGDPAWLDWLHRSARAILSSGIPEKRTPGFWNNVSQCCGSAGVAEFFLDLYRVTRKPDYLDFSRRVTADLLARAARDAGGMRWVQAEHRAQPELLVAQTGYMQGAAGIGMWLLHLDAFERGKKAWTRLPDSPF